MPPRCHSSHPVTPTVTDTSLSALPPCHLLPSPPVTPVCQSCFRDSAVSGPPWRRRRRRWRRRLGMFWCASGPLFSRRTGRPAIGRLCQGPARPLKAILSPADNGHCRRSDPAACHPARSRRRHGPDTELKWSLVPTRSAVPCLDTVPGPWSRHGTDRSWSRHGADTEPLRSLVLPTRSRHGVYTITRPDTESTWYPGPDTEQTRIPWSRHFCSSSAALTPDVAKSW